MRFLFFVLTSCLLFSCVAKKKMVYFQGKDGVVNDSTLFQYNRSEYKLQVNDVIDIQLKSLETSVNELFNISGGSNANMAQGANVGGGDLYYLTGYIVDMHGAISLPLVGDINVIGLTTVEIKSKLTEVFDKYFKHNRYHLSVKLGGIKYSALGEFNKPGKYVILQNQATLFEAIANAGDLNMVASRGDIKVLRQYPDGMRIHNVDLLSDSILSSPYFYIQPNDVIYVEPLKVKSWGVGAEGAQTLTFIVSLLTGALVIASFFRTL